VVIASPNAPWSTQVDLMEPRSTALRLRSISCGGYITRVPTEGEFMSLYRYPVPIALVSLSRKEHVEIDCCACAPSSTQDKLTNSA